MKIRIEANTLATKHVSGVGYFTKRLADSLSDLPGVQVRAFSFSFLKRQPVPDLNPHIIQERVTYFPLRVYAKLQSHRAAAPFDINLPKVDLTIFSNFARWPSVKSRYAATIIHDLTYVNHPEYMEKNNLPHLQRVVGRAVKKSDFLITGSETVKKELVAHFGVDPDTVITTPIPPDQSFYKPGRREVHKRYGIPTEKYIFFMSTIEPRKNIPLLVKAYKKLPDELHHTYSLVIAGGEGWKSEESMAAIQGARAEGLNVIHTGYVDEVDKTSLYQKASVFVMPSTYEGFGMPVSEAMASNIPVVASDIPVFRETGGEGVLYFRLNKPGDLTKSIERVLTETALRKKLIANSAKHLKNFSWEKNAKKIINKVAQLNKERNA